jgi:hypothetical protein
MNDLASVSKIQRKGKEEKGMSFSITTIDLVRIQEFKDGK